jgi:hypothetical protein
MSVRAIVSIAAIFLGLSAAVAQQAETAANSAASSASSALTNPPVFQDLMVDAKGKTVGRLFMSAVGGDVNLPLKFSVVRQISGIWVAITVTDFTTGFLISAPINILKSTAFSFLNATGRPANYACLEGNANFASVSLFEETARK